MSIPYRWITIEGHHIPVFRGPNGEDVFGEPPKKAPEKKKEVINPHRDEFETSLLEGLRKYKGTISKSDLEDYAEKYDLPSGEVQMVKNGEWVGYGGQKIGAWVFADGSHANLQFTKSKDGKFYLETID